MPCYQAFCAFRTVENLQLATWGKKNVHSSLFGDEKDIHFWFAVKLQNRENFRKLTSTIKFLIKKSYYYDGEIFTSLAVSAL